MQTSLKPFNVSIVAFDPAQGPEAGDVYLLPVNSPDEEHAIASTLANAASFVKKFADGTVLPVAFLCKGVSPRT